MKLEEYITEQYLIEKKVSLEHLEAYEVVRQIKEYCKKYLKLIGKNSPLFKGVYTDGIVVGVSDVRQDRKPKGSEMDTFNYVNKWLKKKGWPTRDKSVICTSDTYWSGDFGPLNIIFPIGTNYGYTWIKSNDFNNPSDLSSGITWDMWDFEDAVNDNFDLELADKMLEDNIQGNKGFNIAYKNGYEIWFDCKKYYFLQTDSKRVYKMYKDEFKKIGVNI